MPQTDHPHLVRAIGRWSLAALLVNSIVGSGIFGLPSVVANRVGAASPLAVLIAGGVAGVIMACYAEVGSQFTEAGGPYLYARAAFGRLAGIEMGWLLWLARLTAPAANANLFATYLGEFWPRAGQPAERFFVITLLIGILTLINFRGVKGAIQLSNVFTVAKLVPLFFVASAGVVCLGVAHGVSHSVSPARSFHATRGPWLNAILLMLFAYGGFETGLTPMSEAKDPRRDVSFGLFAALITCTLLYGMIQWTVIGILPDPARSERPLAEVARIVVGNGGATLVTVGALVSVYGYLSANLLAVPRVTFALAEGGDFPRIFSAVHSKFRTPYFSILVFAFLTWSLALLGSFSWNVTLSAAARLFYYGLGCAALPVLRAKQPGAAWFRLPGGNFLAGVAVLACLALITQIDLSGWLILLATMVAALLNWGWVHTRAFQAQSR
jgi:APA family basic amino acid/polyamine antiporter